jgi:hypothetical protein
MTMDSRTPPFASDGATSIVLIRKSLIWKNILCFAKTIKVPLGDHLPQYVPA